MPAAFYDRPEIERHLRLLSDAFDELSSERQMGMGIGPIPWSKLRAYLIAELDLSGRAYDHAYQVIRRVDGEYVAMLNASSDPSKKSAAGQVAATDTKAMRSMFAGLAKRKQKPGDKKK